MNTKLIFSNEDGTQSTYWVPLDILYSDDNSNSNFEETLSERVLLNSPSKVITKMRCDNGKYRSRVTNKRHQTLVRQRSRDLKLSANLLEEVEFFSMYDLEREDRLIRKLRHNRLGIYDDNFQFYDKVSDNRASYVLGKFCKFFVLECECFRFGQYYSSLYDLGNYLISLYTSHSSVLPYSSNIFNLFPESLSPLSLYLSCEDRQSLACTSRYINRTLAICKRERVISVDYFPDKDLTCLVIVCREDIGNWVNDLRADLVPCELKFDDRRNLECTFSNRLPVDPSSINSVTEFSYPVNIPEVRIARIPPLMCSSYISFSDYLTYFDLFGRHSSILDSLVWYLCVRDLQSFGCVSLLMHKHVSNHITSHNISHAPRYNRFKFCTHHKRNNPFSEFHCLSLTDPSSEIKILEIWSVHIPRYSD